MARARGEAIDMAGECLNHVVTTGESNSWGQAGVPTRRKSVTCHYEVAWDTLASPVLHPRGIVHLPACCLDLC